MIQARANELPRVHAALCELEALIGAHYPSATFATSEGDDPQGTYLLATVDVDDTDEVVDVFIERLMHLQIEDGLAVYVIPIRPLERIQAALFRAEVHSPTIPPAW